MWKRCWIDPDNDGIHRVCAGDVDYISTGSHTPVECFVILLWRIERGSV